MTAQVQPNRVILALLGRRQGKTCHVSSAAIFRRTLTLPSAVTAGGRTRSSHETDAERQISPGAGIDLRSFALCRAPGGHEVAQFLWAAPLVACERVDRGPEFLGRVVLQSCGPLPVRAQTDAADGVQASLLGRRGGMHGAADAGATQQMTFSEGGGDRRVRGRRGPSAETEEGGASGLRLEGPGASHQFGHRQLIGWELTGQRHRRKFVPLQPHGSTVGHRTDNGRVQIPPLLDQQRALGPAWEDWLDRLPGLVKDLLIDWELVVDGTPMHGHTSLVLPVRTDRGDVAVLKVTFDGDEESAHEALALRIWDGHGTVRLLRADPRRRALLLERLMAVDLSDQWDVEACEIVAGSYRRLHVPAPPQFTKLSTYVEQWATNLHDLGVHMPFPRRYVDQALALARDFVVDPACTGRLVHGDLHYANVLSGGREPWTVIDPKPISGDPHYEPAPMLWNRMAELEEAGAPESVRAALRRRLHTMVDVAELDEDRARDWVIVRMVLNAGWTVLDARRTDRSITSAERAWLTRCLTVTKAVQG